MTNLSKTVTYSIVKQDKKIMYKLKYTPFKGLDLSADLPYNGFDDELGKHMKYMKDPYILILTLLKANKTKEWIINNYEKLIRDGNNKYRASDEHAEFRRNNYNDLIAVETKD